MLQWLWRICAESLSTFLTMSVRSEIGSLFFFLNSSKNLVIVPLEPMKRPITSTLLRAYFSFKYGTVLSYIDFFSLSTISACSLLDSNRIVGSSTMAEFFFLSMTMISRRRLDPFSSRQCTSSYTSSPLALNEFAISERTLWWRLLINRLPWRQEPRTWARVSISSQCLQRFVSRLLPGMALTFAPFGCHLQCTCPLWWRESFRAEHPVVCCCAFLIKLDSYAFWLEIAPLLVFLFS